MYLICIGLNIGSIQNLFLKFIMSLRIPHRIYPYKFIFWPTRNCGIDMSSGRSIIFSLAGQKDQVIIF